MKTPYEKTLNELKSKAKAARADFKEWYTRDEIESMLKGFMTEVRKLYGEDAMNEMVEAVKLLPKEAPKEDGELCHSPACPVCGQEMGLVCITEYCPMVGDRKRREGEQS